MRISRLCADVARFQMEYGRFVVVENPDGSEMWQLHFWNYILDMQGIYAVKVQMCAAGLKGPLDLEFYIQTDMGDSQNNSCLETLQMVRKYDLCKQYRWRVGCCRFCLRHSINMFIES